MADYNPKSSPRSSSTIESRRRHANQIQRAVENITTGTRVPSRLGHGSLPGSGSNTPRMGSGTPRMGTPRAGWGRHGPFGGPGPHARRRKRVINFIKLLLLLCICYLGVKQVLYFVRYGAQNLEHSPGSGRQSGRGISLSPTMEDGSGNNPSEEDTDAIEDYAEDEELHTEFQDILARHGVLSQEQQEKLRLLADVLLSEHGNVDILLFPEESTTSGVFAHPTSGISGEATNHFYRFTNVKIKDGKILFYGGPAMRQPKRMWFDVTTSNSTSPKVPTTLLVRNKDGSGRQLIEIEYLEERRLGGKNGSDVECKQWIEQPAMIVHTRYPDNTWHAWSEGYLSTFQTARELGYLNIHEIDEKGVITRLGAGLPGDTCPTVADLLTGAVKPVTDCIHREESSGEFSKAARRCNVEDTWCQPGVWAGNPGLGYTKDGPVLVYVNADNIDAEWSSLYSAMASKVRSFDALEGYCIRNLVVGTSRSLKFIDKYDDLHDEGTNKMDQIQAMESLSQDLDDFVQFTRSALRRLKMNNAIEFLGYPDPLKEKLRVGIRLGQGSLIDKVYPAEQHLLYEGYFKGLDLSMQRDMAAMVSHPWAFASQKRHIALASDYDQIHSEALNKLSPSPLPYGRVRTYGEGTLPVVTFISRVRTLNRAILNERQILRYIYWNYEVELRVTDLTEDVDVVADSLSNTDVLIGMHQPEWMHAIFLQPGAVSLQLHPYGWRKTDGGMLRGGDVENIIHVRRGTHLDWVNPFPEFSFFRRKDFGSAANEGDFRAHPTAGTGPWSMPNPDSPHQAWLYANTYADMNHLCPYLDVAMEAAGIPKMPRWKIDELKAIRMQIKDQMPDSIRRDWLRGNLFSMETDVNDSPYDEDELGREIPGDEEEDEFDEDGALDQYNEGDADTEAGADDVTGGDA